MSLEGFVQDHERAIPVSGFRPGQSGNPGGKYKSAKILTDLLRSKLSKGAAAQIIEGLISLATNAKQEAVRIKAAELVFDRIEGKAVQAIQLSQTLDEATAKRLVDIGQMLQGIVHKSLPVIDAQILPLSEQGKACFPPDITSVEKASGKRKYVRSGKYAKANKGRKSVKGEEIANCESGVGIVASGLTAGQTLTTKSTDPTDRSVTDATRTHAGAGE